MAWQANKPEAFAGQHSAQSTPYYIFDEASGIDRIIFETAEGGLTDGEPFLFLFGNGTKNSGTFYESQRGKTPRPVQHPHERQFAGRADDEQVADQPVAGEQ